MATVLTTNTERTPVFPTEQSQASSNNGEALLSLEKFLIRTDKILRKEGDKLYINDTVYDISDYNLIDFCLLLKENKISISFINNNDYWYYPALCIRDFCNKEQHQIKVYSSPFNIQSLINSKNLSIEPYSTPIIEINTIISHDFKKFPYRLKSKLVYIDSFQKECDLIYEIFIKEFSIKLDSKFSSYNKEIVSKYMDIKNDNN